MSKLLLVLLFVLAGCSDSYRYPCQDPHNWNTPQCQKPYCSAKDACPEDLAQYLKQPASSSAVSTTTPGMCK